MNAPVRPPRRLRLQPDRGPGYTSSPMEAILNEIRLAYSGSPDQLPAPLGGRPEARDSAVRGCGSARARNTSWSCARDIADPPLSHPPRRPPARTLGDRISQALRATLRQLVVLLPATFRDLASPVRSRRNPEARVLPPATRSRNPSTCTFSA
ncbi:MAG: hypothetical protein MZV70_35765 [Desulfobacterales bacterium]|nr:hypothetical protein [Desulfobacterales bacterium]